MEAQTIINILIGACGALIGWILKSVKESIRDMQASNRDVVNDWQASHRELVKVDMELADKVQRIEVLVAGTYVKRDDMDKLGSALFAKLDKIEAKLDSKADK